MPPSSMVMHHLGALVGAVGGVGAVGTAGVPIIVVGMVGDGADGTTLGTTLGMVTDGAAIMVV